ncbi:MAG TPA: hypothetical protein VE136_03650 [Anaerolineales bacterium]|nr:hypothetical protein [Anaerolineales bacterium]
MRTMNAARITGAINKTEIIIRDHELRRFNKVAWHILPIFPMAFLSETFTPVGSFIARRPGGGNNSAIEKKLYHVRKSEYLKI